MKKGLMVSTLGILILSLMIVDVQAGKAWQITSPTLKNPVTIDGRWTDPNEWVDGYPISCGGYGWILVKSDSSFLYVMVDFVKDLGNRSGGIVLLLAWLPELRRDFLQNLSFLAQLLIHVLVKHLLFAIGRDSHVDFLDSIL